MAARLLDDDELCTVAGGASVLPVQPSPLQRGVASFVCDVAVVGGTLATVGVMEPRVARVKRGVVDNVVRLLCVVGLGVALAVVGGGLQSLQCAGHSALNRTGLVSQNPLP